MVGAFEFCWALFHTYINSFSRTGINTQLLHKKTIYTISTQKKPINNSSSIFLGTWIFSISDRLIDTRKNVYFYWILKRFSFGKDRFDWVLPSKWQLKIYDKDIPIKWDAVEIRLINSWRQKKRTEIQSVDRREARALSSKPVQTKCLTHDFNLKCIHRFSIAINGRNRSPLSGESELIFMVGSLFFCANFESTAFFSRWFCSFFYKFIVQRSEPIRDMFVLFLYSNRYFLIYYT